MVQKRLVELIDDLDGSTGPDVTTVEFGLDAVTYEIDLSGPNADSLRELLAGYVSVARKRKPPVGTARSSSTTTAAQRRAQKAQLDEIREWAISQGFEVAPRGRIAADVTAAFWKTRGVRTESAPTLNGNTAEVRIPQFSA